MADLTDDQLINLNNACRGLPMGGASCTTTIAQQAGYFIRGQIVTRLLYALTGTDDAFLDRSKDQTASLLPLSGVTVKLFEGSKDPNTDPALIETASAADGSFAFPGKIFKPGLEYKLLAIYKNADEYLKEERVLIEKIKVDPMPQPDSQQTLSFDQKNSAGDATDKTYIKEETESLKVPLSRTGIKNAVLDFSGKAALAFATCSLDVPYINQNYEDDYKTTKIVTVDAKIGDVSGSILCFPTSAAMMMKYYGQDPDTTAKMAKENYLAWKADGFFSRMDGAADLDLYRFTYGNKYDPATAKNKPSNVWEWWPYENRTIRKIAKLPLKSTGNILGEDNNPKNDFPTQDAWLTYWQHESALTSDFAPYLRRQLGRGWPIILGTNLTTAGHVILLRGLVLAKDGSIFKYIVNNPWGLDAKSFGHGFYYDKNTKQIDKDHHETKVTLAGTDHLTLRHGMTKDQVAAHIVPAKKDP